MIKAVVFDLDDTLISEKQYIRSGFKVISNKLSEEYKLDSEKIFNKMLELFNESSKEVFNRLLDYFSIKYDQDYILNLINIYRCHSPEIEFYEDVIPTITELRNKGYKLGIITDGYKETQLRKIEVLKCRELFDEIIITDELGREFWKPHEKSYKLMAEKLDVKLEDMIYVGDNVEKDFVTANILGLKTIKVCRENMIYRNNTIDDRFLSQIEVNSISKVIENVG